MKKQNIIKEESEYNRMIENIKPFKYHSFIIFLEKNNENTYKFGFSVGKKICNAVRRNKIKRQLKNIIDEKDYQNGFKCIIMVRKSIINEKFLTMKKDLEYCFQNLKIYKGENYEK